MLSLILCINNNVYRNCSFVHSLLRLAAVELVVTWLGVRYLACADDSVYCLRLGHVGSKLLFLNIFTARINSIYNLKY